MSERQQILSELQAAFGYTPDEKGGERWIVYQGDVLIVIHPDRKPRWYSRDGICYELKPRFP